MHQLGTSTAKQYMEQVPDEAIQPTHRREVMLAVRNHANLCPNLPHVPRQPSNDASKTTVGTQNQHTDGNRPQHGQPIDAQWAREDEEIASLGLAEEVANWPQ